MAAASDQDQAELNQAMQPAASDEPQNDLSAARSSFPSVSDNSPAESSQSVQSTTIPVVEKEQEEEDSALSGKVDQQQDKEAASTDASRGVASGMQGQAAESATSSNARQQSTSSVASAHTSPVRKSSPVAGMCLVQQRNTRIRHDSRAYVVCCPIGATLPAAVLQLGVHHFKFPMLSNTA